MLPDLLFDDLRAVVADLVAAGYPFQLEWFKPLFELRFSVLGWIQIGPLTLKLRSAHEPWPLLAEEVIAGGVARFIDAATERVQVTLSGAHPGRYVLVCNGHRVPLQETATHGEFIAGVRYKGSNPPATLHPTVWPVQALVFDVIDTWTGAAIGGCTYLPPQPEVWGPIGLPARPPATGEPREAPRVFPIPICRCEPWAGAAGCAARQRRRTSDGSAEDRRRAVSTFAGPDASSVKPALGARVGSDRPGRRAAGAQACRRSKALRRRRAGWPIRGRTRCRRATGRFS